MSENLFAGTEKLTESLCKISYPSDHRFKSYGPKTVQTHKNGVKIRKQFDSAALAWSIAMKICVNEDRHHTNMCAKFRINRLSGS